MKFYITKYALSNGIAVKDLDPPREGSNCVYIDHVGFKIGRDAFERKEDAIHAAEKLKEKRIESLQRQIIKLQLLTFH